MAEAPAEPAPEAPKEEEEPKVGARRRNRIMSDLPQFRPFLHAWICQSSPSRKIILKVMHLKTCSIYIIVNLVLYLLLDIIFRYPSTS